MMSSVTLRATFSVLLLSLAVAGRAEHHAVSAQQLATSAPIWSGSVRCEIDFKGAGYVSHETHTWTLTGAPPVDGSQDYPGTWTVSGSGSRAPTDTVGSAATWKTEGSAPGVRMAIFVRQSDQRLLVFARHGQLSTANGTTGIEERAALGRRAQPQPIAKSVSEWRPFPTIQDAATNPHVTGSSTTPLTRLDASQPIGTSGQAVCTWDLVQGPSVSLSGAASASGATASATAGARTGAIATAAAAPAPRAGAGIVGGAAPAAAAGSAAAVAANTAVVGGVSVGAATGATTTRTIDPSAPPATSRGTASIASSQDGMPNSCASAGNKVVSVSPGAFMIVTGGIAAAGVEDWLTVHFTSASVHVTLGSPVPIPGGSEFQIATYSTCSAPSASPTTGSGPKSLDLPGSGPHDVIVRITASPWSATNATYTLRLEGK
jgi:hypothetical protein